MPMISSIWLTNNYKRDTFKVKKIWRLVVRIEKLKSWI